MISNYRENLIAEVIRNSESDVWESAVTEWSIADVEEDEERSESCVCGKERLRYLFTISNNLNGNEMFPIGSSCIKKFEREELNEEVAVKEKLFKLYHAIENNEFLTLSADLFSRKLLRHLFDGGAFKPTEYNRFTPSVDYQFMLDMFNKRQRSEKQEKRVTAIILNSIRPYLRAQLRDKIRRNGR